MMLKKIISLIYFLILIPTPQIFSQLSHQNLSKLDNIAIEEFNEEDWVKGIDGTINNFFRVTKSFIPLLKKPGAKRAIADQ